MTACDSFSSPVLCWNSLFLYMVLGFCLRLHLLSLLCGCFAIISLTCGQLTSQSPQPTCLLSYICLRVLFFSQTFQGFSLVFLQFAIDFLVHAFWDFCWILPFACPWVRLALLTVYDLGMDKELSLPFVCPTFGSSSLWFITIVRKSLLQCSVSIPF